MVAVTEHSQGNVEVIVYLGLKVEDFSGDEDHHIGDDLAEVFGYIFPVGERDGAVEGEVSTEKAVYEGNYGLGLDSWASLLKMRSKR
jgi:hypothetical protein